tara:strand:+ start:45 stop:236 length:192 start_codon:yes stop_codon:yes gene_type:complete
MRSEVAREFANYLRMELEKEEIIDLFLYCVDAELAEKVNKLALSGYNHQDILKVLRMVVETNE